MTEVQTVKVYELAKELGIDSISLVDKLRGLNITVKNHMSDLGATDVEAAKTALAPKKPGAGAESAKKSAAPRTRKKAASTDDTATAASGATAAGKTTTTKSATTPRTAAAKTTGTTKSASSSTSADKGEKKVAASPVIRRRVKADGETEVVSHPVGQTAAAAAAAQAEAEAQAQQAYEAELAQQGHTEGTVESDYLQEVSVSSSGSFDPVASAHDEATHTPAAELPPALTAAEQAAATEAVTPMARPSAPARKSFLKIVEAPVIRPAPPRPAPTPGTSSGPTPRGPTPRGTGPIMPTTDKDGFRIIRMTKENLDQMVEEEAARKRGERVRETEIKPEDVRFADYRKKEMVFLPKRKRIPMGKELKRTEKTTAAAHKRVVEIKGDMIAVSELASQLNVKGGEIVRKLMMMGQMVTLNQSIDFDTATLIAGEYQFETKNTAFKEDTVLVDATTETDTDLVHRPPVVTIMGHVDHGKTTLLDSIRNASVAAGEAGGITQHIGAYTVEKDGKLITFIDTPGHEAFTMMRARGANVTDIVILVVSADDGVMPQTREALSHAQAAKVPIIVAVNKIDKPGANPEKIKQGLSELNLLAEDWGGDTMFIPVSALKKTNIDKLLEAVLLQAEVLDLKANPKPRATGTVLEARLEKGRGTMVSVLVSRGTLKLGDYIVSGLFSGKVKALTDDKGRAQTDVTPGIAAEVLGFEGVPNAGDTFSCVETERDAREVVQHRIDKERASRANSSAMTLDNLFSKIQAGNVKELNVIVKADVFGSVEAVKDSVVKLSTEKVKVKPILAAAGGITESDVLLAAASGAIIIGFNVRPETKARQLAEAEHVEIKSYKIIYELLEDIKQAMVGLLDKKKIETFLGRAEVRQIFSVPKLGVVAGSSVVDGKIVRGANVRLLRDSRIIFEGKMSSLRRFKDDAKEVATGFECGIGIENYNDLKPGDIIEAYNVEMVTPELS